VVRFNRRIGELEYDFLMRVLLISDIDINVWYARECHLVKKRNTCIWE
jgi:hypothetical protein